MVHTSSLTIVNVGYRSTNYWVVSAGTSRLLVDIGWPGTIGTMKANLNRMGVPLREIRYALATHYHIDHAGLAEELKREGVPLLVLDVQVDGHPADEDVDQAAGQLRRHHRRTATSRSRSRRAGSSCGRIGMSGEILHTPGHSDDSVSLLLDDGSVFTGDLPPEAMAPTIRWPSAAGACCENAAPRACIRPTGRSGRWTRFPVHEILPAGEERTGGKALCYAAPPVA